MYCLNFGAIALLSFVVRQVLIKEPLLEFRVFNSSMFTMTTVINAINTMALFGGMILLPLYLQNILGFSAVKAGLLMLPGSLLMGVMGPITGKIFDKHGVKWLAIIGLAITTIATYEFTNITIHTSYGYLITLYIIRSFGMSLLAMPIMTAGINALDPKLIAHGNAMGNTMRTVAGSIGTALLVTVMTSTAKSYATDHAADLQNATDAAKQELMNQAQVHGIVQAFWLATIFAGAALIMSLFLKGKKITPQVIEEEQEKTTTI
jgi:MFS family permease